MSQRGRQSEWGDGSSENPDWLRRLSPVLVKIWPQERVVFGLRVCKWMRAELPALLHGAVLVGSRSKHRDPELVTQTLLRFCGTPTTLISGPNSSASELLEGLICAATHGFGGQLTKLTLPESGIGGSEAKMLARALEAGERKSIATLILAKNDLGPAGLTSLAPALTHLDHLTQLDLARNSLGDHGAERFAQCLPSLKSVTDLDLSGNKIEGRGAQTLGASLGDCQRLESFNFGQNGPDDGGIAGLAEGLALCTSLKKLGLGHFPGFRLDTERRIQERGMLALAAMMRACTALQHLDLNRQHFDGLAVLAPTIRSCTGLTYLDMSGIEEITADATVTDDGMSPFPALLEATIPRGSALQFLDLSRMHGFSERGVPLAVAALSQCRSISTLILDHNWLGSAGAGRLAAAVSEQGQLERLSMNACGVTNVSALARALSLSPKLRRLELQENGIDVSGAEPLAMMLRHCTAIEKLDLAENSLGREGVETLAAALKACPRLASLDLGGSGMGNAGAAALFSALSSCTRLTQLDLYRNGIGVRGFAALADVARACTALADLNLSDSISARSAETLADTLAHCKQLRKLLFPSVSASLGVRVWGLLASAAVSCGALEAVSLTSCKMRDDEAARLAADLPMLRALTSLDLSSNAIADQGAAAIAAVLGACSRLETLDVSQNAIGDAGAAALGRVLRDCVALRKVNWRFNRMSAGAKERMREEVRASEADWRYREAVCSDEEEAEFDEAEEERMGAFAAAMQEAWNTLLGGSRTRARMGGDEDDED